MIRGASVSLCGLLACAGLFSFSAIANAAPKRGKDRPVVVVVPARGDSKVTKAQLDTIDRALASGAGSRAEVVSAKAVDKRSRGFAGAVSACKTDAACLNKLVRSSKSSLILVPNAKADGNKTAVDVSVANGSDVKVVSFAFASTAELNSAIGTNVTALYVAGGGAPAVASAGEPALEGLADLPLEPLGETPAAAAPPPAKPPVVAQTPPKAPVQPSPIALAPEPAVYAPPPLEGPAPTNNAVNATVVKPSSITWKTYVGAGALVVGAAALTYGIIEYSHHKNIVNDANNDPSLTQVSASQREDEAQSAYNHSRIGMFAGIPLIVVGAGLLTWDLVLDKDHGKTANADSTRLRLGAMPSPTGFSGAATLTW